MVVAVTSLLIEKTSSNKEPREFSNTLKHKDYLCLVYYVFSVYRGDWVLRLLAINPGTQRPLALSLETTFSFHSFSLSGSPGTFEHATSLSWNDPPSGPGQPPLESPLTHHHPPLPSKWPACHLLTMAGSLSLFRPHHLVVVCSQHCCRIWPLRRGTLAR
jgi:hypothetical protein